MSRRRQNGPCADGCGSYDPLAAIPVIAEGVEGRTDPRGCIQLRLAAREGASLASRLAVRLGFRRALRVNLDHFGTRYWNLVDGSRSLADIERALRADEPQAGTDARRAVVEFTRMLMQRHLIGLKLPGQTVGSTSESEPHGD